MKLLAISIALSVPLFGATAQARALCSDCQPQYDVRTNACGDGGLNDEARDLCYTIAKSNLDACRDSCRGANDDDGDRRD